MDFHIAFQEIDADGSGEISKTELEAYMKKKNYAENFVQKWLNLFDIDGDGEITYQEYCNTLGLVPKKEIITGHQEVARAAAAATIFGSSPQTTTTKTIIKEEITEVVKEGGEKMEVDISETIEVTKVSEVRYGVSMASKTSAIGASNSLATGANKGTGAASGSASGASKTGSTAGDDKTGSVAGPGKTSSAAGAGKTSSVAGASKTAGSVAVTSSAKQAATTGNKSVPTAKAAPAAASTRSATSKASKSQPTEQVIQQKKQTKVNASNTKVTKKKTTECKANASKATTKKSKAGKQRKTPPLRKSITPGTVLILLAGKHRGKRVVFLKQLERTGFLLVTGPFLLNGVPLRRVNQAYVIATKTKVDISGMEIQESLDDAYFSRRTRMLKKLRLSVNKSSVFADNDESSGKTYKLNEVRKSDQKQLDQQLMTAIKAAENSSLLKKYLRASFGLFKQDYPHKMVF